MPTKPRDISVQLQIARDATVRIGGHHYRCQPWGIVGQPPLALAFRAYARVRSVDDSVDFLYEVSKDPCVLMFQPMSDARRDYYFRKYLKAAGVNYDEVPEGVQTLNLSGALCASAARVFGPDATPAAGQEREILMLVALEMNEMLLNDGVVNAFWTSPEFGAHHAANLARNGPVRAPGGKLILQQHHARPIVRFGPKR